MKVWRRLKNLWHISGLEEVEATETVRRRTPRKRAQVIELTDVLDKIDL